ncbi:cytochrome c5 family protein [Ideonella sp. 4Y16]|uniref:c-type cytochrome n=1 Tax=Ideonella alba TaxID=2824118 RepID=UPI001B3618A4|nr:c-type cytochrome [Ideonella alba]MBQ0943215.1 cytochrome c5 family protein [Ideonella alba]
MRDVHTPARQRGEASSKNLVTLAVVALLAVLVGIFFLPNNKKMSDSSDEAQAIAERLQPVGRVEVKAAAGGGAARTGEEVFKAVCSACHTAGALGAPKFGDAAAWGPRIKTGYEALLTSALKGKNSMPAQGGGDTSDLEIGRAVVYMVNNAGGKFDEPKAPAEAK